MSAREQAWSVVLSNDSGQSATNKNSIEIIELGGFAGVRLKGNIDESFQPSQVEVKSSTVILDLKHVKRITSFGIREWISMIRRLHEEGKTFFFLNCPVQIINQFNMISGFGGGGKILMFQAPYLCENCDEEREVLVDLVDNYDSVARFEEPEAACPICGLPLEFDDAPRDYFAYVAAQGTPEFPPNGIDFCRRSGLVVGRGLGISLRFRKAVSENTTLLKMYGFIDETMNRRAFSGLEGKVLIDISGVEAVNSSGLERFAKALEKLAKENTNFWIVGSSAAFLRKVSQESVSSACIAHIASINAPYYCDDCGNAVSVHLFLEDHVADLQAGKIPKAKCPKCGGGVEPGFELDFLDSLPREVKVKLPAELKDIIVDTERFLFDASLQSSGGGRGPGSDGVGNKDSAPTELPLRGVGVGSILGKYKLEKLLGMGGMAEVYLAQQLGPEGFSKKVVIKRVLPHLARDGTFIEQFLDEARLTAFFNHPNIVQVFELCKEGDEYFTVMEFLDGLDLTAYLATSRKAKRAIPVKVVLRLVYDLLQGLDYAHRQKGHNGELLGVIHRDISLSNVILTSEGIVKLVDFGIAKASSKIELTKPGLIKGKIFYMAPEQFRNIPIDLRVDIYAVGVVMYELLTLSRLFKGDETSVMYAVVHKPAASPSTRRLRLPVEIDAMVLRALAKDRDKRYSTAGEFADTIRDFCARAYGGLPDLGIVRQWMSELQVTAETDDDEITQEVRLPIKK